MKQISEMYDENYYKKEDYDIVYLRKYSMHWWANRYFCKLIRKNIGLAGKVLEIGCGTGHLLNEISKYYEAYGVEISNFALNEARRNCPGVKIYNISAEDLSCFQDDFFDGILAKHVFEHLERPETAFRECNRVLKERGMLIFVTPNLKCISRHLKKSDWHGFRDPTHISLKQPEEWVRIITDSGFRIEKTFSDGMWDVPYMPWVPKSIQKIIFGSLGGLQAVLGLSILPVFLGESLIILARKLATEEF